MNRAMRDVFLESLLEKMRSDGTIFFLSADFGSPVLDRLRSEFPERFINVGIAEQNLINVAVGLSLEGFKVVCYAIAPFITMRCFEQIRVSIALLSQVRKMNITLVGVGAGFSYDVSGPTHQCLEDLSIMNSLPNISVISPSDYEIARSSLDVALEKNGATYLRFDAKPLPSLEFSFSIKDGFRELKEGTGVCIVSTGYPVHKAMDIAKELSSDGIEIGVLDYFFFQKNDNENLAKALGKYKHIITIEEGVLGSGGLDAFVLNTINGFVLDSVLHAFGLKDRYFFEIGSREYLHQCYGFGKEAIVKKIKELLNA